MKEAPLEGALCLNPRTLSPRCKRVLARYLSVESQAGRVAGRRGGAERDRGGPAENVISRLGWEEEGEVGGRDEFPLPA